MGKGLYGSGRRENCFKKKNYVSLMRKFFIREEKRSFVAEEESGGVV